LAKKKIIIVYQYFGTRKSKWSSRWYDFSLELQKNNYDVTVLTSNFIRSDLKKVMYPEKLKIEGINVEILPFGDGNNLSIFNRIINSLLFSFTASLRIFFSKFDNYIFSVGPITAAIPSLFVKKSKTIVEFRDLWPEGGFEMKKIPIITKPFLFFLQKLIIRKSKQIITCSPAQKVKLLKTYPNANINVIQHGIDNQFLKSKICPEDNLTKNNYWTVVATLGYIHNPWKWISLSNRIKNIDKSVIIVLIGTGPLENKLKKHINLKQIDNLIILGGLNKKQLSKWICKSEFCLFSTLNNQVQLSSAPNKIYDYIAHKKHTLIDLNMWLLSEFKGIIWKLDFDKITKGELTEIRNLTSKINESKFDTYISKLKRSKLVNKFDL